MRKLSILLATLLVLPACSQPPAEQEDTPPPPPPAEEEQYDRLTETDKDLIEAYITANISDLSTIDAVLGGTFYVTGIRWTDDDVAVVEYEDGHIAVTADVVAYVNADGEVVVDVFSVSDEEDVAEEEEDLEADAEAAAEAEAEAESEAEAEMDIEDLF